MASLKIVDFASPMQVVSGSEQDVVRIKGFASVSALDRSDEIVPDPREFNIPRFMTRPLLMVNHKFIKDEYGVGRTAGQVTKSVPVAVVEITDTEVKVKGLEDESFIDSLCRDCAPELSIGDRGLFIHADVSHPYAQELVLSGELRGLSWRGYVRKASKADCSGIVCTTLQQIDLIEISVVHNPNQPHSNFKVVRNKGEETEILDSDLNDFSVYAIRFPKDNFETLESVKNYMSIHVIKSDDLSEDESSYVATLVTPSAMETNESVSISMGGVEMIAAPLKDKDDLIGLHVGNLTTNPVEGSPMANEKLRVFLLDEKGLADRFPGLSTQVMKSVATAEGDIEILTMEFPEEVAAEDVSTEPSVESEAVDAIPETPEETPVEPSIDETPAPAAESIDDLKAQIADLQAKLDGLSEPAPEPETEAISETDPGDEPKDNGITIVEKEHDEVLDRLNKLTASFEAMQQENQKLRETTISLQNRLDSKTPNRSPREEVFEVSKSDATPKEVVGAVLGRTFFTHGN